MSSEHETASRRISRHLADLDSVAFWLDAAPGASAGLVAQYPTTASAISVWSATLDAIETRHAEALPQLREAFDEPELLGWTQADVLGRIASYCVLTCTLDNLLEGTRKHLRAAIAEASGASPAASPQPLPEANRDRLSTAIALWRNKVFAHMAWSKPHKSENASTRATTLMAPATLHWREDVQDLAIGGMDVRIDGTASDPQLPSATLTGMSMDAEILFTRWAAEINWHLGELRSVPLSVAKRHMPLLSARSWRVAPEGVKYIERVGEAPRPM